MISHRGGIKETKQMDMENKRETNKKQTHKYGEEIGGCQRRGRWGVWLK